MRAGDAIAAVTSAVGIQPCSGCQRSKELLNAGEYRKGLAMIPGNALAMLRGTAWTVPPEAPKGWTPDPRNTERVMLFCHVSGCVMVWDTGDGQYRNAHQFCSDRAKAEAEFQRRLECR